MFRVDLPTCDDGAAMLHRGRRGAWLGPRRIPSCPGPSPILLGRQTSYGLGTMQCRKPRLHTLAPSNGRGGGCGHRTYVGGKVDSTECGAAFRPVLPLECSSGALSQSDQLHVATGNTVLIFMGSNGSMDDNTARSARCNKNHACMLEICTKRWQRT